MKSPEEPVPVDQVKGHIEFRNVWFAYQDEDWVLKDVSFVVQSVPERRVCGSHRSRQDYYHKSSAALLRCATRTSVARWRGRSRNGALQVALEFQRRAAASFLFSENIAGNIRLGNESITTNACATPRDK